MGRCVRQPNGVMTDQVEKAELHCHLDGLLCPAYIMAIQAHGFCHELDLKEMQRLYPIKDIDDWFRLQEFLAPHVHGKGELLLEVLKLYLRDLAEQGVRYAEIMLCSFLDTNDEIMDRLMQRYRNVAADLPEMEVGLLWAIGRSANREKFERKIERIISLWQRGYIDGIALAGDEKACKVRDYADIFQSLAQEGIPVEIHAGEWCGPESIWDALEYGHPRRIGHALCLFDNPELPKYVRDRNIHIEFCPTSNLKVGGVQKIGDYPVFKAIDYDLNFSINTDDPGHFECTMNSEFSLLQSVRSLEPSTFEQIFRNSLSAAFADSAKRVARQALQRTPPSGAAEL